MAHFRWLPLVHPPLWYQDKWIPLVWFFRSCTEIFVCCSMFFKISIFSVPTLIMLLIKFFLGWKLTCIMNKCLNVLRLNQWQNWSWRWCHFMRDEWINWIRKWEEGLCGRNPSALGLCASDLFFFFKIYFFMSIPCTMAWISTLSKKKKVCFFSICLIFFSNGVHVRMKVSNPYACVKHTVS